MLATANPHVRDELVKFDPSHHAYRVGGDVDYVSVTTLVHRSFPGFDADAAIDAMMAGKRWEKSPYHGMSREAIKEQWARNGKEASVAGTALHAAIEDYYNGVDPRYIGPEWAQFLAFDEWRKAQGLVPLRAEWIVYDEKCGVAGTIDMCFTNARGNIEIYDWKRVKAIKRTAFAGRCGTAPETSQIPDTNYHRYSLQLALYQLVLTRRYGVSVDRRCLVCLHPDHETFQVHTAGPLLLEAAKLLRAREMSLDATAD
jgi:ATP-dependent exoDNAse (exonuclease V) beta subunit